jgi:hypothetical protein
MVLKFKQTGLIFGVALILSLLPLAAMAAGGGAHASNDADGKSAHRSLTVEPVKISLIGQAKLAELDRMRHRELKTEEIKLNAGGGAGNQVYILIAVAAGLLLLAGVWIKSSLFHRLAVTRKLYSGFSVMVVLALAVGLGGWYFLSQVSEHSHLETSALDLDMMANEINTLQYEFVLYGIEDKAKGEKILAYAKGLIKEYQADFDAVLTLHLDAADRGAVTKMKELVAKYDKTLTALAERYHAIEDFKELLDKQGKSMEHELEEVIHRHENELKELEADANADSAQIALQTGLVEHLFEAEVSTLKMANAEVAFLLDKDLKHIPLMETNMGKLYGYLAAAKKIIPPAQHICRGKAKRYQNDRRG